MNSESGRDLAQQGSERGVYTLANDTVIEWFEAFIRSFRKHNPVLPLTVIPFNREMGRVEALQDQFHFEIMDDARCIGYDELADKVKVSKRQAGCFRKFACFSGKYREFLFLDSDIVTLVPLDSMFETFSKSPDGFVYFDTAMDMCYKGKLAADMVSQYNSPAYNSGIFFSRRELIARSEIFAAAEKAAAVCDDFVDTAEQPFINYVTDTLRIRSNRFDFLMPEYAGIVWARQPLKRGQKKDEIFDDKGRVMPFIHWPGCTFPTMERPGEFLRYRVLGKSLSAKIGYMGRFYFLRYQIQFFKTVKRWKNVLYKFSTNKAWRRFYFCKLVGIKVDLPA
jgi:hypothetical protein